MWIRSGDIRGQGRKLSEIVQNFWTIFSKIVLSLSLLHRGTSTEKKFCEDTPSSPEVIELNTLNFRPNFKFSRLEIFWGTPSQFWCALARLDQSVARVKISERSTP